MLYSENAILERKNYRKLSSNTVRLTSLLKNPQMNTYNGHSGAAVWQLCRISRPQTFADEFANDYLC